MIPMLVARRREECLFQRDNLLGPGGSVFKDNELPIHCEEIGEPCCSSGILSRRIKPTKEI